MKQKEKANGEKRKFRGEGIAEIKPAIKKGYLGDLSCPND